MWMSIYPVAKSLDIPTVFFSPHVDTMSRIMIIPFFITHFNTKKIAFVIVGYNCLTCVFKTN